MKNKGKYIEIRKRETYAYMLKYYSRKGSMPSLKEIGQNAYHGTTLTPPRVCRIIGELEKDGKVRKEGRKVKIIR